MVRTLSQELSELQKKLTALADPIEPPASTLEIIGSHRSEKAWQRLLLYLLNPNKPHGLEHDFLNHFLTELETIDDLNFSYQTHDLENIRLQQEVTLSNNRIPDAVIWSPEEWFLCLELKIDSPETQVQTRDYVEAESFEQIDVEKIDIPAEQHHYLYLAPESAASPAAPEFIHISWRWVADVLQSFIGSSHDAYPARTTAQLREFIGTIQNQLTMTEYQENEEEKAALYFEYYDELKDVQQAFDNQWDQFAKSWGIRLGKLLEDGQLVEVPDAPELSAIFDSQSETGDKSRWVFMQSNTDWAGITKADWFRDKDDFSRVYSSGNHVRFSLYHRLELNRERAIEDRTLELKFWHSNSNSSAFQELFKEKLDRKLDENPDILPAAARRLTGRGAPLVATYEIPVTEHDDFFTAYLSALETGFRDLLLDNPALTSTIDEVFEESLEVYK